MAVMMVSVSDVSHCGREKNLSYIWNGFLLQIIFTEIIVRRSSSEAYKESLCSRRMSERIVLYGEKKTWSGSLKEY